jgi:hypothetical protein
VGVDEGHIPTVKVPDDFHAGVVLKSPQWVPTHHADPDSEGKPPEHNTLVVASDTLTDQRLLSL